MELVGGDADLGAEAEFAAVGEAGGDVVHDAGGIDGVEEFFRLGIVGGDDAVGVVGAVGVDVGDGGFHVRDDFDGEDFLEILGGPVFLGGGDEIGEDGEAFGAAAQLDFFGAEGGGDFGEKFRGDGFLDEEGFEGVADAGLLGFGIDGEFRRPFPGRLFRRRRCGRCRRSA